MKFRLLIFVVSLLMASEAFARVVEVRSGEHDTFSRIVLNIPAGTHWALKQTGKLAELSVDLPNIQFDTSEVFSRIPRGRLLRLSQRQPGRALRMEIGCECKVTGFTQSGTLLVVDVQDVEDQNNTHLPILTEASSFKFSNIAPMKTTGSALTWSLQPEMPVERTKPTPISDLDSSPTAIPLARETPSILNSSELRLLSQVDRAAKQGLLLLNIRVARPDSTGTNASIRARDTEEVFEKLEATIPVNVTAVTSMDRDHADANNLNHQRDRDFSCMPATLVAVPDWGNALPFGIQIGNRRSNMYGEFDNVNQKAVIELTRNLLFFGFGAEAKKTLDLFTGDDQTRKVLNALAETLDHGRILTQNPFLGQQVCNSDVALWAYLAEPDISNSKNANTEAILTGFARLPDHLRVLLGPVLATKFSESRDRQSADIVLRTANRTLSRSDPALDLAQANADFKHKDPNDATKKMALIGQSGTEKSPHALIDLVEAQVLADQSIPPEIPNLIAAYLTEFRKSDLAPKLLRAHILSLAITGRFDEALQSYFEQEAGGPKVAEGQTLSQVMYLLTKRANDIVFLRHALAQIERPAFGFSIELQSLLAIRIIELGFPDQAATLLAGDMRSEKENRSLMNAQIAISENLPHRALVELLGVNDPLAMGLRTEAFLMIGEYENAGLSLQAAGADSGRAFWHAENWEAVISQNESQYLEAAVLAKALRDTRPETESQGPLASAKALTDSSLATRSDIMDLLGLIGQAL